jgi:hypothetical protein
MAFIKWELNIVSATVCLFVANTPCHPVYVFNHILISLSYLFGDIGCHPRQGGANPNHVT